MKNNARIPSRKIINTGLLKFTLFSLTLIIAGCGDIRQACVKGNLEYVKEFLRNGGNVNLSNKNNQSNKKFEK